MIPSIGTNVRTAAGAPVYDVVFVMSTMAVGRIADATIRAIEIPMRMLPTLAADAMPRTFLLNLLNMFVHGSFW